MRQKPSVCGRLFHADTFRGPDGVSRGEVDVCDLPPGHEGEHHGKWSGVRWTRDAKTKTNSITGYDQPGGGSDSG